MMPLVAILSTIETVACSATFAPLTSFASSDARIDFSAVRSLDRIWRLCSRRLMFCRLALRADFVRLAKESSRQFSSVRRLRLSGDSSIRDCTAWYGNTAWGRAFELSRGAGVSRLGGYRRPTI